MSDPSFTDLLPPDLVTDAPSGKRDLCDLLGWLMQLQGTVRIAGLMDAVPRPKLRPRRDGERPAPLAAVWDWRVDSIERAALYPLREPFSGKGALLDAAAAHAWLAGHGALRPNRSPAVVANAAAAIGGELHQVVAERIAIARAGTHELRSKIGKISRELGGAPAYLELLDQALRDATETRTRELFARIPRELARRFEQLLGAELAGLPPDAATADIELWYGADGWLLDHVATCRVALRAACGHEARALKGFVASIDDMTGAGDTHTP